MSELADNDEIRRRTTELFGCSSAEALAGATAVGEMLRHIATAEQHVGNAQQALAEARAAIAKVRWTGA